VYSTTRRVLGNVHLPVIMVFWRLKTTVATCTQ